jgi:predicted O-methyltransferase YrrM
MINKLLKKIARWIAPRLDIYIKLSHPRPSILEMKKLNKKQIIAVEVGTFKGKNASEILKSLNIKKLYLIDPYSAYKEYENDSACFEVNEAKKIAKKRLAKWRDKIVWIHKFSEKAAKDIPDADFIYLDGNHDYKYVKKDLKLYWPKVKKGGILAGHDIDSDYGVYKALSEFTVKNKLLCTIRNQDWIIKK